MHSKLSKLSLLLSFGLLFSMNGCTDDNSDEKNTNSEDKPGSSQEEKPGSSQEDPSPSQEDPSPSQESADPVYLFGNLSDEDKTKLPIIPVKTIEGIGQWPTDIDLFGDFAYVVDPTNNVIHRIHLDDLSFDKNYINLGQEAAPYAANADENALYVAVQGKNAVVKYPHDDVDNPVTIASDLIAPTAIYSRDGALYIADSEYDYADSSKTGGRIYVYDGAEKKAELVTTSQNPGFLEYCPMFDWLFTVNSGVISFYPETKAPEKSCIDVWEIKNLKSELETEPFRTFCVSDASFGRATKNQGTLYVGDALKPFIYAIRIDDVKKDGAELKTIKISSDNDGLTIPVDMGDYLGVVEFNRDMLYLRKGDTQTAYRLSKSDAAKKNPMDAVYDTKRKQLLIMNANAGTVDVLKVTK